MMKSENINCISREIFARLLASENITVEHRSNMPSAAFDVKNRVLLLPVFKNISENVYDLFVAHECSHALNTDRAAMDKVVAKSKETGDKTYHTIFNCLEDARIEKLIKRRFPGLAKYFFHGYNELAEQDFFGIRGKDLSQLHLIDRINLYFKIGTLLVNLPFSDEEKQIVEKIKAVETTEQVLEITDYLYEMFKQQLNQQDQPQQSKESGDSADENKGKNKRDNQVTPKSNSKSNSGDGEESQGEQEEGSSESDGEEGSDGEENSSGEQKSDGEEDSEEKSEDGKSGKTGRSAEGNRSERDDRNTAEKSKPSDDSKEHSKDAARNTERPTAAPVNSKSQDGFQPEIGTTLQAEEVNKRKMVEQNVSDYDKINYAVLPKDIDLTKIITSYKDVNSQIQNHYTYNPGHEIDPANYYSKKAEVVQLDLAKKEFAKFKQENMSLISYLVKEFEMKKAADDHKRTLLSKTGAINTNKLHAYKFVDDLFLKKEVVVEGKNHGLVMFIDGSSSMSNIIADTYRQMLVLVLFCKKVNIPFEVYGFFDGRKDNGANYNMKYGSTTGQNVHYVKLEASFELRNYFSSKMTSNEFYEACVNIQALVNYYEAAYRREGSSVRNYRFSLPNEECLNSTPLNSTILCAEKIINNFRKANDLQKVNAIFLTDGDSNQLQMVDSGGKHGYVYGKTVLRDSSSRKETKVSSGRWADTAALYRLLHQNTGARILGFYVVSGKKWAAKNFLSYLRSEVQNDSGSFDLDSEYKKFQKDGSLVVENQFGYNELYVTKSEALEIENADLDIDTSATNRTIAKKFGSSLKGRVKNKIILSSFVDQIC